MQSLPCVRRYVGQSQVTLSRVSARLFHDFYYFFSVFGDSELYDL